MYLFGARLGEVDSTLLTGVIKAHREEVVLEAITICQEKTRRISLSRNSVGPNQLEAWSFVSQNRAILIFSLPRNTSHLSTLSTAQFLATKKIVPVFSACESDHRDTCLFPMSKHTAEQHLSLWCLLIMSVDLKYHFLHRFSSLLIIIFIMPCRLHLRHQEGESLPNQNSSSSKHKHFSAPGSDHITRTHTR